jgi:hypothetical protein
VLVEAQPGTGAQHPTDLRQRPVRVGDGAQHQAGHHRVEGGVGAGQRLGDAVGHPDRHRRLVGRGQRQAAQVGLGLHGQDLGDGGRVVREVEAVAGADLQDPPLQAGEQPPAVVADLGVHEVADPGIAAGEQGMADRPGPAECDGGHRSVLLGSRLS